MTSDTAPSSPPSRPAGSLSGAGIGSATGRSTRPSTSTRNASVEHARGELKTAQSVGVAITFVYLLLALATVSVGRGLVGAGLFLIAALFGYGTAQAREEPKAARVALGIGAVLGAPLGLTMLFLIGRIRGYEDALRIGGSAGHSAWNRGLGTLAGAGRDYETIRPPGPVSGGGPQGPTAP